MKGSRAVVPERCTCCLEHAEDKEMTSHTFSEGNVKHTRSFEFPICKKCKAHRTSLQIKQWFLIGLSLCGSWAWSSMMFQATPSISFESLFMSSSIACFIIYFIGNVFLPFKKIDDKHGGSERSVKMVSASKIGLTLFEFSNLNYANQFAFSNGSKVDVKKKWKHARGGKFPLFSKSAVKVMTTSVGALLIVLLFGWSSSHATLYIDNASPAAVSLALNGKTMSEAQHFTLPTGITKVEKLPVGDYEGSYKSKYDWSQFKSTEAAAKFKIISGGLKQPDTNEKHFKFVMSSSGNWILNLGRANAYKLKTIVYGSVATRPIADLGNPEFFKTDADYIFEKPPKSISTKSGGETRTVLVHSEADLLPPDILIMKKEIDQREMNIKRIQSVVQILKSRIDNNSARIKMLESMGSALSEDLFGEHNELVDKTNRDIQEHNQKISDGDEERKLYEQEIDAYNTKIERLNSQ